MIDKLFKISVILCVVVTMLFGCVAFVSGGLSGYRMAQEKHAAQQKVR